VGVGGDKEAMDDRDDELSVECVRAPNNGDAKSDDKFADENKDVTEDEPDGEGRAALPKT